VLTDGLPTARVGDQVTCSDHNKSPQSIATGSSLVLTNGKQTARIGDKISCGAIIKTGSSSRIIDDVSPSSVDIAPVSIAFSKPTDPPVTEDPVVAASNQKKHDAYIANPSASYNPVAEANGVKANHAEPPDTTGMVDPEPPKKCENGHEATVIKYLQKVLAEAATGAWRETGQHGAASNPNIVGIWRSLGFPDSGIWKSDQTAWCAGFVNLALKESGLPYLKEAGARNVIAKGTSIGMQQVAITDMQPGDICLWSFNHVNFCYTASGGRYSFVGGNQTPQGAGKNNPDDGDITNSWKSGWTPSKGGIVAVMRPGCPKT
jgi:hypothetical protein